MCLCLRSMIMCVVMDCMWLVDRLCWILCYSIGDIL